LPRTIQTLHLRKKFTHFLSNLPDSLIKLTLESEINEATLLPPNLQHLELVLKPNTQFPPFPSTLKELHVSTKPNVNYTYGMLPDSLRVLLWRGTGGISLAQVPEQIETLSLWENFVEPVEDFSQFHCLTKLIFRDSFNAPIDGLLPPQLKHVSEHTLTFSHFILIFFI
jgi:hypothetical protein